MKSSVFAHEAEMVSHNLAHEVFGFCRDVSHGRRGKVARSAALALALCREAGRSCVPRRASVHTDRRFTTVMAWSDLHIKREHGSLLSAFWKNGYAAELI